MKKVGLRGLLTGEKRMGVYRVGYHQAPQNECVYTWNVHVSAVKEGPGMSAVKRVVAEQEGLVDGIAGHYSEARICSFVSCLCMHAAACVHPLLSTEIPGFELPCKWFFLASFSFLLSLPSLSLTHAPPPPFCARCFSFFYFRFFFFFFSNFAVPTTQLCQPHPCTLVLKRNSKPLALSVHER